MIDIGTQHSLNRGFQFVAILSSLVLISCREEDRILTVTCGPLPGTNISVDMGGSVAGRPTIGFLNTHQFSPGTILQLSPAATAEDTAGANVAYILRTTALDYFPPRPEVWLANIVSAHFETEADEDVKQALDSMSIDWGSRIAANTGVWIAGAQRNTLRDPLRLVNADPKAVGVIRSGTNTWRFAVVSAASHGGNVGLTYSAPTLAVNTIEVANFYLHLKYACSTVSAINANTQSRKEVSVLFFTVPVKYDPETRTVVPDTEPMDLAGFGSPATR